MDARAGEASGVFFSTICFSWRFGLTIGTTMHADVVIIGGGVIGLLLARELSASGVDVLLLERGALARESSWAGGGIVSPLYPWRYSAPVTALARWAQAFYPQLCADLLAETGIDAEYQRSGLLMLDAADYEQARHWSQQEGRHTETLNAEQIVARQAGLRWSEQGLWMPELAQLRPPRLTAALAASLRQRGKVRLLEQCEVLSFERDGERLCAVNTRQGRVNGQRFVLCAGAWSGRLGEHLGLCVPVRPVRGQMLLFQARELALNTMVLHAGKYLIPRRDGRVLVGSTLEEVQFDARPTEAALQQLQTAALTMMPGLARATLLAQWAGLRPGSPKGIPLIGRLPGFENAWINAGHFRNGVVLAPAATRLLADELLERPPIVDPEPYRLGTGLLL